MSRIHTLYQVVQSGRVMACGSLRQCWMYLVNAYGESMTAYEMSEREICIEPAKKELAA